MKATKNIIEFAFNKLKLKKIYLNVMSNNVRAIKFYKKMEFQYEGTFKQHIKIQNQFKRFNNFW